LVNGAIFATAAVLAVDEALTRDAWRGSLLRVLLLLSGLAATGARGSTAAAVLGIGLLILIRRGPTTSALRKVAATLSIVVAGVAFVGGLAARNSSSEGQRSTQVRTALVEETKLALRGHELLGVGPGEVENYRQKFGLRHFDSREQATTNIALESTYAELLVGLGIPGVALFLLVVIGAVTSALRSELLVGPACALLTYALALGTFKTEGHVHLLVVFGLLLSLTAAANAPPSRQSAIRETL
jgi:O-antigen ligase